MTPPCSIHLWGTTIGAVSYKKNDQSLALFEYHPKFLNSNIQLSPISMPLRPGVFSFPNISQRTFKGLPGILVDSLPDKFGNQLIDQHMASKGYASNEISAIDRLLYVGQRGMGALEYQPALNMNENDGYMGGMLDLNALAELSQVILSREQKFLQKIKNSKDQQVVFDLLRVGTSAGGARAKALVAIHKKNGDVLPPNVMNPQDYSHWLVKFDGVDNNQDRDGKDPKGMTVVEYIYSMIAQKCGIDMPRCQLLEIHGQRHFLIERFDRVLKNEKLDKLHYASWCGLAHAHRDETLAYSYEQLVLLMRQLNLPQSDIVKLFKRAMFNIIGRNQDDHTKNFGFLMDRTGQWSLSPAFDMTYAYDPTGQWTKTHQITLNGKGNDFQQQDLLSFAQYCNLSKRQAKDIIQNTIDAFSQFEKLAKEYDLNKPLTKTISSTLRLKL
ncbi:MAG TPA: type II toxin-antitoxin system HipA family toxin [Oligoflexia bacterium]|nr:type II toxin-antitoxin system HipA family toxin [Oligoflexia bacterium]HMR23847.1 type II toxin-antitoxin system HipA family toxin [Oligoflexia bacterium]